MAPDMWRWWWYDYQWLLSFYLYTLMKNESYKLGSNKAFAWKDLSLFIRRMKKFKDKCIMKYWDDFNFKVEILVEWEELCLDDITFISKDEYKDYDNNIFIQVKTKGWDDSTTISTSNWIYKAVSNFISNINFQKDKNKENILFFIFTNKDLTRPLLKMIEDKNAKLYNLFANYIIWEKQNIIYPVIKLNNLNWVLNSDLIVDILNNSNIFISKYLDFYEYDYLTKLTVLIKDLNIIFNNLDIITKINHNILEDELEWTYWELIFLKETRRISKLCWWWDEIIRGSSEFDKYTKYTFTYFTNKEWWKFIHEIDRISKWKFI